MKEGWNHVSAWVRDFRLAVRRALRRPTASAVVVMTLALGIGAGTTVFAVLARFRLRTVGRTGM